MPESIASPTLTKGAVRVAVSGSINLAPVGTTVPTSTTGSLNAAFKPLGYLSEDGLEESIEVSREQIRAWQNAATVREVVTEAKLTYAGVLIETTVATVEAYYATTVTQTATHGTYTITPGKSSGAMAGVITILDGTEVKVITCTRLEVFKASDAITYANGEAIGYPIEIVCYDDPVVYDTSLKTPA